MTGSAGVAVAGPDETAVPASGNGHGSARVRVRSIRVAELVGPVGAGKTTLRSHLVRALAERGLVALDPVIAVEQTLGRSRIGSLVRPLLARPRAGTIVRTLLVDGLFGLGSLIRDPRLGLAVIGSLLASPLPWWHRRRILRLWLEVAGRQAFVRSRLRPAEVLVIDEGLVHRAVNLFAWLPDTKPGAIRSYLDRIQRPDLVVVVDVPAAAAAARVAARGLPKRLQGRDDDKVAEFLSRVRMVLETTDRWLAAVGVATVLVDNGGHLQAAVDALDQKLAAVLEPTSGPAIADLRPPAFEPRFGGGIPRPRRSRRLPGGTVRPGLDEASVTAVLAGFGLRPTGAIRSIAGGRGTSVVIDTERGPVVVKRYKLSLDEVSLRGEHAILRRLELADFPAPRVLETPAGHTFIERRDGRYAAFGYLDGYQRADTRLFARSDARHLATVAGATLGALHVTLDGYVPPSVSPNGFSSLSGPRVRDVAWYLRQLESAVAGSRSSGDPAVAALVGEAEAIAADLGRLDADLAEDDLGRVVVHGDYGPYNLLVRPGRPLFVVDFELARLDWHLTDLATAIPRFAGGWLGASMDRAVAFASGYAERGAIRPSELERLPAVGTYLALRRAIVCWARWAQTSQPEWLEEATEKMELARAYRDGRHPFSAIVAAVAGV